MKQLKSTVIIVLFLTFLLILNTIGILFYRESLLSYEIQEDHMLKATTKYEMLSSMLYNNATLYFSTNDESYHKEFAQLLQTYSNLDIIPIGSQIFTGKKIETLYSIDHIKMKSHRSHLAFTSKEHNAYQKFIDSFHSVLNQLSSAVTNKDPSILTSTQFQKLYRQQNQSILEIYSSYMKRIREQKNILIKNQFLLEATLIFLTILLFFMSILLFYLLVKENASNLYFRKLYKTIVENIHVGLSIQDNEGKFEYMNSKCKELLKVGSQNIIDRAPNELFTPDIAMLLETSETRPLEGNLKMTLANVDYYMYYNNFTICDENKQKKYINLFHDTTQTEKMQNQLQQQLKEIEFHSRAKDAFLANVSHEIKTPINAVIGMTYFLKETNLNKKQTDLVSKIENSSNLLLGIINDVLDLSKIKANSLKFYPTVFPLTTVLKDVEDMFISYITQKGLKFETYYNFDPNLFLYLDRTRLLQVLVNLMTNAYKFTDSGHIVLSVEVKSETTKAISLEFCVEDSGIGILSQDMDKLFQEFEQLENHLTKKHTGTGLGLTICKYIVKKMEGNIWVTSNASEGSKFYFTITANKANKEQMEATEAVLFTPKKYGGKGIRVLLVEDNEINQEVATNLLKEVHFICDTAEDGMEAINLCKKHPVDYYQMILMDIHMPRMDGYTASTILKNELHIPCPILAVTATSLDETTKLQYRDIISDFILKPFKIDIFYYTIFKYLPKKSNLKNPLPPAIFVTSSENKLEQKNKVINDEPLESNNLKNPFSGKSEAIKNLGGLETAYYKHVTKFQKNYVNSTKEIQRFLEEDNYEEAKRLAHSVKGLAGTLGMSNLHKAATVLDKNISEHSSETEDSLMKYQEELENVIAADPHKN